MSFASSSTENMFPNGTTNLSFPLSNGQSSSWQQGNRHGGAEDSRAPRGFSQRRPRGRGGFRGRRRGSRFRGGDRRKPWDTRGGTGQLDVDKKEVAPGADIRQSLRLFYELQRTKQFPPLLKGGSGVSSEVENEICDFLRKNLPDGADHARYMTLEDFRHMGLSPDAVAHLDVLSSEGETTDMVAARRLSGTVSLQLEQWEQYFNAVKQLHAQGVCSLSTTVPRVELGVAVPSVESEAALTAIDEMLAELDRVEREVEVIADVCRASQMANQKATQSLSADSTLSPLSAQMRQKTSKKQAVLQIGVVCAAVGVGLWCMTRFRA